MTTPQQTNIHSLVRDSRQRKYKTAKEYWEEHQDALRVSYPHYSAVEAGTKFPDIQLAIAIAKTLKIELKLICHVWAKDQMPDAESRAFFDPIPGAESQGIPTTARMQLDEFYVFTEKQIPLFREMPSLWEVLMAILAFSDSNPLTEATIVENFGIDAKQVRSAVEWLRNEGLVYAEGGKIKARRRFYHLPNTPDFKAIRDQNFKNASADIIKKLRAEDLSSKEAYRTTFTRRITRKQAAEICEHVDNLIGHLGNMPDLGNELFSMAIAFGPRAKVQAKPARTKETS